MRLDYALSHEQENTKGGKMYIQDKVEEYSDEVFNKDMLAGVCESKGIDFDEWLKGLKKGKQWHVEVH